MVVYLFDLFRKSVALNIKIKIKFIMYYHIIIKYDDINMMFDDINMSLMIFI